MSTHSFILVSFWACVVGLVGNTFSLSKKRGADAVVQGLDIAFGAFMIFWGGNLLGWW